MIIVYIDILLLIILLFLVVFMCGYCAYRVNRLRQNGEIAILLKPTKVVFSHKKEGESTEELRTVVAYKNPLTGDYCVHKSRLNANGYVNHLQLDSPDSGVSDEYEPLNIDSMAPPAPPPLPQPHAMQDTMPSALISTSILQASTIHVPSRTPGGGDCEDNSVNKTWNWNYKEYQI